MPTFVKGNIWDQLYKTDLICITTNSTIKNNGSLVMGRGIALEAKNRFKDIDIYAGRIINHLEIYGLKVFIYNQQLVGLFQTKDNWKNNSSLKIIEYSCKKLCDFINNPLYYRANFRVDLPYPGINNGRLTKDKVYPIISKLPDNVYIWERY